MGTVPTGSILCPELHWELRASPCLLHPASLNPALCWGALLGNTFFSSSSSLLTRLGHLPQPVTFTINTVNLQPPPSVNSAFESLLPHPPPTVPTATTAAWASVQEVGMAQLLLRSSLGSPWALLPPAEGSLPLPRLTGHQALHHLLTDPPHLPRPSRMDPTHWPNQRTCSKEKAVTRALGPLRPGPFLRLEAAACLLLP